MKKKRLPLTTITEIMQAKRKYSYKNNTGPRMLNSDMEENCTKIIRFSENENIEMRETGDSEEGRKCGHGRLVSGTAPAFAWRNHGKP